MTIALSLILTAFILAAAWLLGQLTVVATRLAAVFVASWIGYAAVRFADMRQVGDVVQAGLSIALALAAVAAALFVLSPLKDGLDDYFYNLDAQMEAEAAEVQP